MADHPADDLTVGTGGGAWKGQLRKLIAVRMDITTEVDYNHAASCAA
jgi:hypothetical protein